MNLSILVTKIFCRDSKKKRKFIEYILIYSMLVLTFEFLKFPFDSSSAFSEEFLSNIPDESTDFAITILKISLYANVILSPLIWVAEVAIIAIIPYVVYSFNYKGIKYRTLFKISYISSITLIIYHIAKLSVQYILASTYSSSDFTYLISPMSYLLGKIELATWFKILLENTDLVYYLYFLIISIGINVKYNLGQSRVVMISVCSWLLFTGITFLYDLSLHFLYNKI